MTLLGKANPYQYAGCNPTNYIDPTGRCEASDITAALIFAGLLVADAEATIVLLTGAVDVTAGLILGGVLGVAIGLGYLYCAID